MPRFANANPVENASGKIANKITDYSSQVVTLADSNFPFWNQDLTHLAYLVKWDAKILDVDQILPAWSPAEEKKLNADDDEANRVAYGVLRVTTIKNFRHLIGNHVAGDTRGIYATLFKRCMALTSGAIYVLESEYNNTTMVPT